jgi:lysyl-tRNA synthetase class 2
MKPEEQLIKQRKDKIDFFIANGMNPYATKYDKSDRIREILEEYEKKTAKGEKTRKKVSIAGRIMSLRIMGKATFGDIQDGDGRMQFYANSEELGEKYNLIKKLDLGDIVGMKGTIFKTHKGELSVWMEDFELLTKSVRPLPEKWHGLKDTELRYRQRYVDLIMNPEVKRVFLKRAKIIAAMREFLSKEGFTEVETPILQPIYGGTNAKPFDSKLNALNMKVYMRISNELYLKRLVVGGYEKIFEFSQDFRNEGIDKTHNPEFLQMETMWAYADYKANMDFTEQMVSHIVKEVCKEPKIQYQGNAINFKTPWKRISLAESIKKRCGVDVLVDFEELKRSAIGVGVDPSDCDCWGKLVEKIFEEKVEKSLMDPTIVYDYPADTSPLAKKKIEDPKFVERFELYINGWEIANSYSELNDPMVLMENWKKQEAKKERGDEEAQVMDEDFVRALEYGMPPTSGVGVGIDRLVMLLTDSASIRDVMFFPFMRTLQEA